MPRNTKSFILRIAVQVPILFYAATTASISSAQETKPVDVQQVPSISNPPTTQKPSEPAQSQVVTSSEVEKKVAKPLEITLSEPIEVIDPPFYYGGSFSAFGAIGGLIGSQVYKNEPERISAYVKQENIKMDLLVKTEFERQFNGSEIAIQKFKTIGPGAFKLTLLYGITSVPFSKYRPYISIKAQLVNPAGKVLWKDREWEGSNGKANCIPYPDFFKSAKDFQSEFEITAQEVVAALLKDFQK